MSKERARGPEIQEIRDLLLRDVLERLTTAVRESAPFESFREACLHLELGLNALEHHGALPPADQDPEVCRGLLLELAVTCLKAVCNLYPPGRETTERSAP